MDDQKNRVLTSNLNSEDFFGEAKSRWLRPSEIIEILRNYRRFNLTSAPPNRPPSGSLFLFDRKVLRFFRRDGYCWRKKKDGKTLLEAHEKLKSGNVDALHCYYAHGEDNEDFQRRIYWLLDEQLENIVLVHYRDLSEGSRILMNTDSTSQLQGAQISPTVCSTLMRSSTYTTQASYASTPSTADLHGRTTSGVKGVNYADDVGGTSLTNSLFFTSLCGNDKAVGNVAGCSTSFSHPCSGGLVDTASLDRSFCPSRNHVMSQNLKSFENHQNICGTSLRDGSCSESEFSHHASLSTWPEIRRSNQKIGSMHEQTISFEQPNCPAGLTRQTNPLSENSVGDRYASHSEYNILPDAGPPSFMVENKILIQVKAECALNETSPLTGKYTMDDSTCKNQVPLDCQSYVAPQFERNSGFQVSIATNDQHLEYKNEVSNTPKGALQRDTYFHGHRELNKLDSFGRWMDKEIGKDCDDLLTTSVSGNYWNAVDTQSRDKEICALSSHMHLDMDPLGPSLSQEQLFSIQDFSPDWAYSGVETKILISGTFLGGMEPASRSWCCMFGEYEVPAEVLTANVIRCQAPAHAAGRVPFYITCSNRLACSEVREFEYRGNSHGGTFPSAIKNVLKDDIYFQIRFAKILSLGVDSKMLACSVRGCHKCDLKKDLFSMLSDDENEWDAIEMDLKALQGYNTKFKDVLIQKLLKGKLCDWLVCKAHEEGKGPNVLDEDGLGVIHLAAALGYQWAVRPIVIAGVSPSFRDARGRTGLHWSAYYGREDTTVELVRLGAAPGAVEDPTSEFPEGKTAADLASLGGHKGIAGYLAEIGLSCHLSKLAIEETVDIAAEKSAETVRWQHIASLDGEKEEKLLLGRSLAAVRNSVLAAARIQDALRSLSSHQRQLTKCHEAIPEIPDEVLMLSSINNKGHRLNHFNDYLHTAAVNIQHKQRGCQGNRSSLKTRNQIVRTQAHVRGRQVRKQYRKIVWSVSMVEKAILRWRRKGSGLRGFQAEEAIGAVGQTNKETDDFEYLHIGRQQKVAGIVKALVRVQSMARNPEARKQYMRLLANSHESKLVEEGSSSSSRSNLRRGKEG